MFAHHDTRGSVEIAFTDRHGGVSGGPFASLNLAEPPARGSAVGLTGTDLDSERVTVEENLDIVAYALARGGEAEGDNPFALPAGVRAPVLVRMRQVHGAAVHTVDRSWLGRRHSPPEADALVTDLPGVILLARAADCVPVLVGDPTAGVVAAVHAGRAGLVAGVVPAAIARMVELGARDLTAWVGPAVCGRCYEVPATMRDDVAAVVPASSAETSWGTPALDLPAGVVAQLRAAGADVVEVARCTVEDEDLYSHRRDGTAAGRFGGLVWIRP